MLSYLLLFGLFETWVIVWLSYANIEWLLRPKSCNYTVSFQWPKRADLWEALLVISCRPITFSLFATLSLFYSTFFPFSGLLWYHIATATPFNSSTHHRVPSLWLLNPHPLRFPVSLTIYSHASQKIISWGYRPKLMFFVDFLKGLRKTVECGPKCLTRGSIVDVEDDLHSQGRNPLSIMSNWTSGSIHLFQ